MTGYPFTFLVMYFISILTSATTFRMKDQARKIKENEKLIMEGEKEKLRANLLRAVSHDLRTPLTSMIGASSSYLENEEQFSPEERRELVSQIYEDANWLLHMVENLLSVTRITQVGNNALKKTPEAVEEVVFEAVATARKRYPELLVHVNIPTDFLIAPMDPLLIKQVILNLLENAYFHAPSNRPLECSIDSDAANVCIHIRDFGGGIDPEKLETIFDAMPSAPSSAADTRKGMGIGLSICKAIVTAHDGTIHVLNHEDGAEFYFTLPKEEIHLESDD
jgi:two-component system sensor histidine kinase KdpD